MQRVLTCSMFAFLLLATPAAVADTLSVQSPGNGKSGPDLFLFDNTVNTGFGTVFAGDVIICGYLETCTGSSTTDWSAMLVFYNPSKGPFVTDSSGDATDAVIFVTLDTGFYLLSNFEANYDTGVGGANGLSSNYQIISESDRAGDWSYGGYTGTSPQTVTPEPTSLVLLGSALLGLGVARRKFARRQIS